MSSQRLPPLSALRVFEAAARYESFNRAAEALHVTPSAVSHQVRSLEEFLGVALFHRLNRQVTLTAEGRAYLPPIRDALEQIHVATEQIRGRVATHVLALSVAPAFASGWLMPRLAKFQLAHPELEVRLISSVEVADLARSDVDVGIRTGSGDWPGLASHRLIAEELVPVCSPALVEQGLRTLEDLRRFPRLHELPRLGHWRSWLNAVGLRDLDAEAGPKFQGATMVVEAAAAGLGVALANRALVEEQLRSGRLVVPFDIELPGANAYYLVYLEDRAGEPKIAAFSEWIVAEAAAGGAGGEDLA